MQDMIVQYAMQRRAFVLLPHDMHFHVPQGNWLKFSCSYRHAVIANDSAVLILSCLPSFAGQARCAADCQAPAIVCE